eukprot:1161925-Pelagomonas_calceolata.AAC.14
MERRGRWRRMEFGLAKATVTFEGLPVWHDSLTWGGQAGLGFHHAKLAGIGYTLFEDKCLIYRRLEVSGCYLLETSVHESSDHRSCLCWTDGHPHGWASEKGSPQGLKFAAA